jgi:Skp family chaperone for outer membrane proteins
VANSSEASANTKGLEYANLGAESHVQGPLKKLINSFTSSWIKQKNKDNRKDIFCLFLYMKKIISIVVLFVLLNSQIAFAEEVQLSEKDQIEKKIQTQVDTGLGTIKLFLSERWECKDILDNKVIKWWYTAFINEISQPMESRKSLFDLQSIPLQKEIDTIKTSITTKNQELKDKKQAFVDEYIVTADNNKKLLEIDTLKNDILDLTSQMNIKSNELTNITTEYNSHVYIPKEEITASYESKIFEYCETWYGKVELTDKKTLEQVESDLSVSIYNAKKVPAKYKKMFDKIDVLYVKKPKSVQALYTRLDKVIRKLSKTNKDYDFIFELRKHIQTLLAE